MSKQNYNKVTFRFFIVNVGLIGKVKSWLIFLSELVVVSLVIAPKQILKSPNLLWTFVSACDSQVVEKIQLINYKQLQKK